MKHLDDKVAAVTGAGSGIGRALALHLADRGCRLALSDVDAAGLAETERLLTGRARAVTTAVVDVAEEAAVAAWADAVVSDHGRANLVFNNAGVALSGTVMSLSTDDYRWIMGVNFWGVVHGTKAFLPHLEASGEGHVVNISSVFGLTAQPLMSGYNASKYAVRGFTESLRQDLELTGSRVSATCVHPGGIKTNIARSARMDASVASATGKSAEASSREFEKAFITTPAKAAEVIVGAVQKNKRRVLSAPTPGSSTRWCGWPRRLPATDHRRRALAGREVSRRTALGARVLASATRAEAKAYGLRERRVDAGDSTLAVLEGGPVDAPAVVLLHGYTADRVVWMRFAKHLVRDHRVVLPELAGHGASGFTSGTGFSRGRAGRAGGGGDGRPRHRPGARRGQLDGRLRRRDARAGAPRAGVVAAAQRRGRRRLARAERGGAADP